MSDINTLIKRVEELEMKVSFQDDGIEQLNKIITKQDSIIRKMEERFLLIGEKIQDMESQMPSKGFNPADELPPHY
ncbi:SlyX family protein [Kangiella sp. HZ709]|uniref:SlyX family protein n=1 Tax=Kangiella sp. HZ709 TaxID=2666328 RepID=UPI0012AFABBD|nr:SlyX family protein [Kangiella sp. HZ709]MRX27262.1 SlyX protein [Kangiella sp. HZ709]